MNATDVRTEVGALLDYRTLIASKMLVILRTGTLYPHVCSFCDVMKGGRRPDMGRHGDGAPRAGRGKETRPNGELR